MVKILTLIPDNVIFCLPLLYFNIMSTKFSICIDSLGSLHTQLSNANESIMVGQWYQLWLSACFDVFRALSDMSVLIITTGRIPASLVLSWVVKYKIKESLTIRKSLCSFFPYTVFVPMLLDPPAWWYSVKNPPRSSGWSSHNTRTVKAKLYKCNQKVRAFGSV